MHKVIIIRYEDGITLTALFFIILPFDIIYSIFYKTILLYDRQIFSNIFPINKKNYSSFYLYIIFLKLKVILTNWRNIR